MTRLQEIKESFNRGHMNIDDIKFLIHHIEVQESEIRMYENSLSNARKEIRKLKEQQVR